MNDDDDDITEEQALETLHRLDEAYWQLCQRESYVEKNLLLRLQREETCLRNALDQNATTTTVATTTTTAEVPLRNHAFAAATATTTQTNNVTQQLVAPVANLKSHPAAVVHQQNIKRIGKRKFHTAISPRSKMLPKTEQQLKLARLEQALLLESNSSSSEEDDDEDDDDASSERGRNKLQRQGTKTRGNDDDVQKKDQITSSNDNHDDDDDDDEQALLDLLSQASEYSK
jgi:hypothetical protein